MSLSPIIFIPARMAANRLPGKPLADICGDPMIVHVWRRAMAADLGPVVVACGERAIFDAVAAAGGRAVMTRSDHPSGTDRIFEALTIIDPERKHDVVVNLQGDLPTIEAAVINAVVAPLAAEPSVDIATLAFAIDEAGEVQNPNVVKAVIDLGPEESGKSGESGESGESGKSRKSGESGESEESGKEIGRSLDFTRAPTAATDGRFYHHVGIYAYRRAALETFVALPPSPRELTEKLEQLRALDAGMRIDVALVDRVGGGVDTPSDLEAARRSIGAGL